MLFAYPFVSRLFFVLACFAYFGVMMPTSAQAQSYGSYPVVSHGYPVESSIVHPGQIVHAPPLPPGAVITQSRVVSAPSGASVASPGAPMQHRSAMVLGANPASASRTHQTTASVETSVNRSHRIKPSSPPRGYRTARVDSAGGASNRASDPSTVFQLASARNYRPDNTTPFAPGRHRLGSRVNWQDGWGMNVELARQLAVDLRRRAENSMEIIADIAQENADLADQWADVAQLDLDVAGRVVDAQEKLAATTGEFHDVQSKLANYGLTPTIGLLLRHKKEQLDGWQVHDSQTFLVGPELARSRQLQLELELVRFDGTEPVGQSDQIIAEAGTRLTQEQYVSVKSQLEELLGQRYQWLGMVHQAYDDYQEKLGQLASATTASAELTGDFRKLIDRHVTWIRSGDAVSLTDVKDIGGGVAALLDSNRSSDFGPTIGRKWKTNPAGAIGTFVFVVLMLVVRWRAKTWLLGVGGRGKMRSATRSARKIVASLLTVLVSVTLPAVLYVVARWLAAGVVSESTLIASSGLFAAALVAWTIELPRQLLRNNGYLQKHIELDLPGRQNVNRYLMLFGVVLVVGAYTVILMESLDHGLWRDSVARFGFMGLMLLVAWGCHFMLRPKGGFLEPMIAKYGGSVIHHCRFVLYLAAVGFPLAMVVLSALGYGYTAHALVTRAMITLVGLMVAATLWGAVKAFANRAWQMMTGSVPERKFDQYGEIEPDTSIGDAGVLGEHYLELRHHLAFLCQCVLVVGGLVVLGWLWVDALPDIGIRNPVVWTVQDTVNESVIDATGQTVNTAAVKTTPITLLHLVFAAATLFAAFQIAKLLPALFDALVLQRVSFDEGMEHFSLVLGRFLLFAVGCIVAGELVGLRWQTIQWLIVGLAVGLGFGLQDMVRNLFGGLIVLFEKPARLGDLVTIGDVTGRVSMQRLRTTVVADDEGREVIVPNKNFVTQDVVQWLGAGRLSVIPIEVAVTRDERPADICRSLTELVIEQPDVLLTPAPQATLVCVGKRSQRIEVRAWIEDNQDTTRYRDELLKTVRGYLAERKLLGDSQPSQPKMSESSKVAEDDFDWDQPQRRRKRRA